MAFMLNRKQFFNIIVLFIALTSYYICKKNVYLQNTTANTHDSTTARVKKPKTIQTNKQKLILHIGPRKTATTFLQLSLLGSKIIKDALREDNITKGLELSFNFRSMNRLIDNCLYSPINTTHCKDESIWRDYISKLEAGVAMGGDQNAILHSCEAYSKVPDNNFSVQRLRSLEEHFDVKIIIFYRRPAGWFPSMYHQYRKGDMYKSGGGRYINYLSPAMTFPEYMEKMKDANESGDDPKNGRNPMDVALFFQRVFPDKVKILDYHAPDIGVEFFCNGLLAPKACAAAKNLAAQVKPMKKLNQNLFLLFDEDLLITHAYEQRLLSQHKKTVLHRHEATLKIQVYLDTQNRRASLPQVCLSPSQHKWLWDTTLLMEEFMLQYSHNYTAKLEEALKDEFHLESKKFCHLDVTAYLSDREVRSYLQSCDFIQENKTATTSDGRTCF